MAYFNTKQTKYIPQPIPPTPPYVPPVPPIPPESEEGSTPDIPRDTFTGTTNFHVYKTTDENNKLVKTFIAHHTFTIDFKDDTSVINPVILLSTSYDLTLYNYAYIEATGRYYYIDNIEVLPGNIFKISMTVDVLMSFNDGIKELEVIVDKTSMLSKSNKDIDDNSFVNMAGTFRDVVEFKGVGESGIAEEFTAFPNYILITIGGPEEED